jgi:hypothetical protein
MSFGLDPSHMSPEERLAEICELLALGVIRLKQRQSRPLSRTQGESCLHFVEHQCRHEPPRLSGEP